MNTTRAYLDGKMITTKETKMNTKKVDNEKITIKQVDYENFKQVTTAGDVIEIIRAGILYHETEGGKCGNTVETQKRHFNKRHGLEMVLDSIVINEAKMQAWQDMKGPKPLKECGDQYKQLANGAVYYHDNSVPGVMDAPGDDDPLGLSFKP